MENLEKILSNSKNLTVEEENALVLKSFEPISLALYNLNKETKRLRDKFLEMEHKETIERNKIDLACKFFKIKQSKIENNIITKTMDCEFNPSNPELSKEELVNKLVNKCKDSSIFLIFAFSCLDRDGFINRDTEWYREMHEYVKSYYPNGDWKENVNLLPKLDENELKKTIEELYSYLKVFKSSPELKRLSERKEYYYDLKNIFLHELSTIGLRATEVHGFGNQHKVWTTKNYLIYGGFGFHVSEDFPLAKDNIIYQIIDGNITSEMNEIYKMDTDTSIKIIEQSIKLLNDYKKSRLTYKEVIDAIDEITDKHKELMIKINEINERKQNDAILR